MSLEINFSDKVFENRKRNNSEYEEITLTIRRDIIKSLVLAKSGHSGGPLGITEVISVLFFGGYMKYNPSNPNMPNRDRFVLSAGHMAPVQYSVLARAGFFPTEELKTLRKYNSRLQGHPGLDMHLPGIETSSGSLGQGVSIAVGMAMSDFIIDKNERKVFCITGDGELQEGASWEAAMAAGSHKLSNFCWIVDNNDCQIDGRVKDILSVYPLKEKFESFNFNVIEIDGHDIDQIQAAFDKFNENHKNNDLPTCIIAKTYMGQGVSFMKDQYNWHGNPPNEEQAITALSELK
ncbi:MAG: transketolase [Ignavibacteriae bacterium]|nr:transketolase [Ignavibacteriota bacterium]